VAGLRPGYAGSMMPQLMLYKYLGLRRSCL
jgi:hypothetical protein